LPALGVIPQFSTNGHARKRLMAISSGEMKPESPALISYVRPNSEAAEAYRALRTAILLSGLGEPPRTILVTSPFPQEGKTTISANIALVLAQRGSRVLLVDADLRRPGLEKMLGLKSNGGLSTLLSGVDKIEDVVVRFSKVPQLWILPAGPVPPQPAELLGSEQMNKYIARWREEFEHVIIDTPPCLSVTDATLLSSSVDRVLLVARSGQTQKPALRRACDLLFQVNAKGMGIVLNAFDMRVDSYYYGQYAKKYYSEEVSCHVANPSNSNSPLSDEIVDRVS
jgi:succinoglycan biosynthesis transport protein ExoP